ncbi:unnamed protein product [Sphagnum troendelagicum]|uniref:Uncharacterized protein n=1 Tax=Sphagnum troendelagicum TaxID=128251 RepID=A0ABP0V3K0_9BRYO
MIWRWGKSSVISNVELGMLLILPCVVLASFLSTTAAWHHSRPAPPAPWSVPSPPSCSPHAPSRVPSPPFCSRSVVTTIWSSVLALSSLMIHAWGQGSAMVSFTKRDHVHWWNNKNFWWRVLWTIVLALNPIVGTFYVLQTLFVTCKFHKILRQPRMEAAGVHANKIARFIADTWVGVGVAKLETIPKEYNYNGNGANPEAKPDPRLVLNLAGTGNPRGNRQWPEAPRFQFFLLNYEGMLALLCSGALDDADYKQMRFLGRKKGLEIFIIFVQSISYITAVVYRRIQHLRVTPIEGIGFTGSLLFLVYALVQYFSGSISKEGLLIYLTPAQEEAIQNFRKQYPPSQWSPGMDHDLWAFRWTIVVGCLVVGVATWLLYPVLTTKSAVDVLGHIIFYGDFFIQFIFLYMYFREHFGAVLLLFPAIVTLAGVALAIYATKHHWHDQNFDIPTPSLGTYFPVIR